MKHSPKCSRVGTACFALIAVCFLSSSVEAQKHRSTVNKNPAKATIKRASATPAIAVVVDERLAVLRFEPNLAAIPLQRMRAGRTMRILNSRESNDGLTFYQVSLPPEKSGWVQAEAVVRTDKRDEDARHLRLIRALNGFDKIESAVIFLETFPKSALRPSVLLLLGDLVEAAAPRLSRDAARRLSEDEIKSNFAPVRSYFLNFNGLDRYRRLGISFVFNEKAKQFHYDGAAWREILQKHKNSQEATEAKKRLDALAEKVK